MYIYRIITCFFCLIFCFNAKADEITEEMWRNLPREYQLKLQVYRFPNPIVYEGDTIWCYLLPEMNVYKPLVFKNKKQKQKFDRLVYNVKKVLPIAQLANKLIEETYLTLETLPTKKEKDEHIKRVEKDIKKQFTPQMKKLTLTQGKLLIKLIDRECNQSSFQIVKAFLGPFKANFYQVFAWTFNASLKKTYHPEDEDAMIERVVVLVETGQL